MLKMCDVCEGKGVIGGEECNQCKGSGNVHIRGEKRLGNFRRLDKCMDLSEINVDNYGCYNYYADMSKDLWGEMEKAVLEQKKAGFNCNAVFISFKFYSVVQTYATARFSPFIDCGLGSFIIPSIMGRYVFFHDKEDNLISFTNVNWKGLTW